LADRDEAAFEILLERHGPMVLGVCRRVLRNEADAQDAFQSTFLVFVRKAVGIRPRALVGNWLYGVAHNTALRARAMNNLREVKERQVGVVPRSVPSEGVDQELIANLDRELSRLPNKYRAAIVFCELEGRSLSEVARLFGCPQGTVASRLARGREMLAARLSRSRRPFSVAALAAVLASESPAVVPTPLVVSTVRAATAIAADALATPAVVPQTVLVLANEVVKSMASFKLKTAAAVLLGIVTLGGLFAFNARRAAPPAASSDSALPVVVTKSQALSDQDRLQGVWMRCRDRLAVGA
jgi:RNA polymerase sigma factor (sigma-70 family)